MYIYWNKYNIFKEINNLTIRNVLRPYWALSLSDICKANWTFSPDNTCNSDQMHTIPNSLLQHEIDTSSTFSYVLEIKSSGVNFTAWVHGHRKWHKNSRLARNSLPVCDCKMWRRNESVSSGIPDRTDAIPRG